MTIMFKRILADLALLVSVVLLNFWITLVGAMAAIFYFKNFYEAIAIGIMIDLLYGVPLERFFHIPYMATIIFVVLYAAAHELKQLMRVYESR